MDWGTETVVQPPETHNVFLCLAIIVVLIWSFNSCRRCWAVMQLRRALGSRRLVAIRGAGSRVHIFRLLTRNYLQRTLARNHLQALVHTRQAYPPKTMPCTLLLATPFNSNNGGIKATLHPRGVGDQSSPTHPTGAAAAVTATSKHANAGALDGVSREDPGTGALVGVSVELDCRVACTVELLWDVDLAFLGRDMGLPPKLQLLPAATRENGDVTNSGSRGNSRSPGSQRSGREGRARGIRFSISRGIWNTVNWLASGVNSSTTTAREDTVGRDAMGGGEIERPSPIPQQEQEGEQGLDEEIGNGGRGDADTTANLSTSSSSRAATVMAREGRDGSWGNGGQDRPSGQRSGLRSSTSSWAAAMGFQKSSVSVALGERGTGTGTGGANNGGSGGSGVTGWGDQPRCAVGECGKRTMRRVLPPGDGHVFEALPGESYFRVRDEGVSRPRPSIGDSVLAGRCSLVIVIRPADEGDGDGDWRRWRHRPTHRVTRQLLLVQLKEREEATSAEGVQLQQPPSADVLRHLVAISGEGQGEAESIYSFSEVFGAGEETGGATRRSTGPSVVDSAHATAGFGSASAGNASEESGSRQGQGHEGTAGRGGGIGIEEPGREESLPDECVICLTEPKSTVLLPCRHLCVCNECFRHVDKCPVCRAAFDNYVVLEGAGGGVSASTTEVSPQVNDTGVSVSARDSGAGERGRASPAQQQRRNIFAVSRRRVADRGAV